MVRRTMGRWMRGAAVGLLLVLVSLLGGGCDEGDASERADGAGAADAVERAAGSAAAEAGERAHGAVAAGSAAVASAERRIVFIGTSLTAGLGVGEDQAYPAVLQEKIDSAGLPYEVVNAGISGETSAGGLRRIDWLLQNPVDVLVLELGANDGLRGLDVDAMRDNLDAILTRARQRYPDVKLVVLGMEAPPNLGRAYTDEFRGVFAEIAEEHDAAFLPFLLEDVAAVPAMNQDDGIHPNARGHRVVAENVWPVLQDVLSAG